MSVTCPSAPKVVPGVAFIQQASFRSPLPFRNSSAKKRTHSSHLRHAKRTATYAGLLDFLSPPAGKSSPQAEELVDQLLELARGTNGGSRASVDTREQLEGLVNAAGPLACACIRSSCGACWTDAVASSLQAAINCNS
jgi:hypothetical protein